MKIRFGRDIYSGKTIDNRAVNTSHPTPKILKNDRGCVFNTERNNAYENRIVISAHRGWSAQYLDMYSVGVHDSLITRELREYFESCGIRFWTYCPDTDDMVKRHLTADSQLLTCNEIMPAIRILNEMGKR